MILEETLIRCGFDEKDARMYLALLELGMEKVQTIAKKAGIKRSTAYVILEQLHAKNYVSKTVHHKKTYYSAENPEVILQALQDREQALAGVMPLLKARMNVSGRRPKIKIYEGKSGVQHVYDEIYESGGEVSFFGSMKNLSEELGGLTERITKIIKSKKIHVRDLLMADPHDIDFAMAASGKNYEGRVVSKQLQLLIGGAIYGNKVAIISIKSDLFAVIIENEEVAKTFQSFFEFAWSSGVPFENYRRIVGV